MASRACWRVYSRYSVSVTLEARQRLESIKTLFTDIICLKELENYLLVRSISLDEDKSLKVWHGIRSSLSHSTFCLPKGKLTAL